MHTTTTIEKNAISKLFISLILPGFLLTACVPGKEKVPEEVNHRQIWVDSVYATMNLEEKVGQLFMAATYSNREPAHTDSIQKLIEEHHIGGVIFFQGGPVRQVNMINRFQQAAKIPLMVGIDAEWGISMRLDSTPRYPYNMTLGAIQDNELIEQIGRQIGLQCRLVGVHNNYAPVVDINTNPANPVIGTRSFGEDRDNVTAKALAFMTGMQSQGILACAKHFPGHGDTATDSHKTLPVVDFSAQRIDSVELHPYKKMISNGLGSVMVAHLEVPQLEEQPGLPSSLSHTIVTELLKDSLKFEGLIMTDALNMKGVSMFSDSGSVDLTAFLAGHDVLLFSENVPVGIASILKAFEEGRFTEERLTHSVKKILAAKYAVGLHEFQPLQTDNLIAELNTDINKELHRKAAEQSITILRNEDDLLPLKSGTDLTYLRLGDGNGEAYLNTLSETMNVKADNDDSKIVVVGYHRKNYRRSHKISSAERTVIQELAKRKKVILHVFASQYALVDLDFDNIEAVVISYENSVLFQEIGAKVLSGELGATGRLPARFNGEFDLGYGIDLKSVSTE
jgi:beta-N-acetylhexosaminidase